MGSKAAGARKNQKSTPQKVEQCATGSSTGAHGWNASRMNGSAGVALPVIGSGRVRPSGSSRWRAFSLMAVHVLMIAHFAHWMIAGETVTPVEPSESMETITSGRINAGFIFFGVALLATLVLGRWLCGWGCHLVAYQDLTLWVLKKFKLRPKAFRSRLLLYAPLAAAFYMFFLPEVARIIMGEPRPPTTLHLTTTGFWDTFPQYGIAILTLLFCGVAIIYFLGPKGFCTYACPYGALFVLTDKLAPARIRVTDACRQCGHCTSVCTSNVKVAEEVKLYGMVVDPGCMKCLDCVSVCPNDALYFGFGRPSLGAKPVAPRRPVRWDLTIGEDLLAVLIGVAAFLCFRGLYGKIPFLMSVGLAGIVTFLVMKAVKLFYQRDVLLQRTRLKAAGQLRPIGTAYACSIIVLLAITAHSGIWRYHDYMGGRAFLRSPPETFRWPYDFQRAARVSDAQRERIREGIRHLEFARRWGLYPVAENELELAWLYLHDESPDLAAAAVRRAIGQIGDSPTSWMHLARIEVHRGQLAAAREAFEEAVRIETARREGWSRKLGDRPMPLSALIWSEWGMFLAHCGEADAALSALKWAAAYDPSSAHAQLALANFYRRMNDIDAARSALIATVRAAPAHPEALAALNQLAKEPQNFEAAAQEYEAALADTPQAAVLHYNLGYALTELKRYRDAAGVYRRALEQHPGHHEIRADYGAVLMVLGDVEGAAREYAMIMEAQPQNAEAAVRLGYLSAQLGRGAEAMRWLQLAIEAGDENHRAAAQSILRQLQGRPQNP